MERDQWYKPNLLYNIHYRPPKQQEPPKMIVETRIFNPSVCTCGKHGCDPHYRMERVVVWSSKAEDAREMKHEASKQDTEDGHNDNSSTEDDSADDEKEVANVRVKSVIGGTDEKYSGDIANADGGNRNSVDCMENGNCGDNGVSGENEMCNSSTDHGSIGNDHGGRNGIGNGENSIGCCDDGFVDRTVGYGSIGNDPGDRSCIENGEDRSGCDDDNCFDRTVGYGSIGNDPGDRSCIENDEDRRSGCGDDGSVDCIVGYGSIGNDPGDRSCIENDEDRSGCGDDGSVDCIVGYGSIGNDPGDRSCIENDEDRSGCGDDGSVDCIVEYGSIGNRPGGRICVGNGEDRSGCGDDSCVDCIVADNSSVNNPGDRRCIGNGEDRSGCGDDGCVHYKVGDNSSGNDGGGQLCRQWQVDIYIKSTGPLHITIIAPPQLDSIPTEKANVNVRDITIEPAGTIPKCSQLKTKTRYNTVRFCCTDQLDEAEEKRITQEAEDALERHITVKEAIQKERKSVGNGVTKRKSIGTRIRGVLRNLFCCKSRSTALDD